MVLIVEMSGGMHYLKERTKLAKDSRMWKNLTDIAVVALSASVIGSGNTV